ncbi:MAG: translocation/assembly module TamB domain-containing protein, partial [Bacteroidaceae bacterium]|nr:translocation/assembly module TamB domain-containing protein [Bacteroidaceae bacterium]
DAYGFGTSLHMADETVRIKDNRLQFNNFSIYAKGDNPFKINGSVDFTRLTDPAFELRMNADSYELINSTRRKGSMFYGKLFVDTRAMIGGTLKNMRFYGDVTMLGKSNITYVMLDAPIESDKELDGLVEFVNFNDTTAIAPPAEGIDLGNINLNLSLKIEDGARINADLDEERNNYVTTQGSGNLHITYTGEAGLNVTGRYTMDGGDFKLSLPIIPLKTLQISDGSSVSWTGQILEPELDITALERITSSVTFDDNSMQPVPFDVGVKVSNTLSNMGLSFIMSSPENATVQEQLNTLDTETMNRYAVTMLITGAYAGSSKSLTVANALNSFIDAKINNIAGTALKSVSVNVGINDATNAETGSTYKNYSFSFSKRFWNDRITFVIGGEVNSGEHNAGNDSFINNASLEWKLSENSNRFLKLFYDKNYQSILEGEITEMGIGYVYKRKLNRLKELFIFRNSRKEETGNTKRDK